ncbi:MAG: nucleotidyltransferase family protein [Oligoflexia bacterium]|nr:nucleotidyltransferase family protein [Oligoflexia bacterium]
MIEKILGISRVPFTSLELKFIENHNLFSLIFYRRKDLVSKNLHQKYEEKFKRNWIHTQSLSQAFEEIESSFKKLGITYAPLKGISLITDYKIYTLGERPMCDIDLLVSNVESEKTQNALEKLGYSKNTQVEKDSWEANNFKEIYTKNTSGIELVIEVHYKLFYLENVYDESRIQNFSIEDFFIHLCGHYVFQHTMSQLTWFFDCFYFLKSYKESLNLKKLKEKAILSGQYKSVRTILKYIYDYKLLTFPQEIVQEFKLNETTLLDSLINEDYLLEPYQDYFKYQVIKFLCKDKLSTSFSYLFGWFQSKIKNSYSN